jgi:ABC-type phosphate/phosphonate transport system substrate-binding protein
MSKPTVIGAVMYDPKVTVIWKIIGEFFEQNGCPITVAFYESYDLMVGDLMNGNIDVAWNSPLAWLDAQRRSGGTCRAIAMRDTDRDRISHIVVRKNGPIQQIGDLRQRTIAFGAKDSPQAALIPMEWLKQQGLAAGTDYQARCFDVKVGLHGDHIGGELEAFECLSRGEADASVMIDLNFSEWTKNGKVNPGEYAILASTPTFDHCNFTVRQDFSKEQEKRFLDALFSMTYDNPKHREMMDLEGLKAWEPGRTSGYEVLAKGVERQRFFQ